MPNKLKWGLLVFVTFSQKSIHHWLRSFVGTKGPKLFVPCKMFQLLIHRNGNERREHNWFDDLVPLGVSLCYNYNLITQRQGRGNGSLQWYYSIWSWSKSLKICLFIFCCQAPLFLVRWEDLFFISRIKRAEKHVKWFCCKWNYLKFECVSYALSGQEMTWWVSLSFLKNLSPTTNAQSINQSISNKKCKE